MPSPPYAASPPGRSGSAAGIPCVGAIVRDDAGRLLLVRRARPPAAGRWSLPGGRVEAGELDEQAVAREVAEETGLAVRVGRHVGSVELPGPDGQVYAVRDYQCAVTGGALRAGDDASDAGWYDIEAMARLQLTDALLDKLREWHVV